MKTIFLTIRWVRTENKKFAWNLDFRTYFIIHMYSIVFFQIGFFQKLNLNTISYTNLLKFYKYSMHVQININYSILNIEFIVSSFNFILNLKFHMSHVILIFCNWIVDLLVNPITRGQIFQKKNLLILNLLFKILRRFLYVYFHVI